MTQAINPVKLKASAEHLERVLSQYPDNADVQSLLHALLPLIEAAKSGQIAEPMDRQDIPSAHNFAEGIYIPYKDPDVGDAYARFITEMEGGLTEQDTAALARIQAMRDKMTTHE